jgi:hypothetical protein
VLEIKTREEIKNSVFPVGEIIIPIILFALAIIGTSLNIAIYKWISAIGSLIYIGIIKSSMLSVIQIANIALLNIPSPQTNPIWFMIITLNILTLLFFGNVYCGLICPFGTAQEIIKKITRDIKTRILPDIQLLEHASIIRYYILFSAIILSIILGKSDAMNFETFVTMFSSNSSLLAWSLVILMLIFSIFHHRFWCKYLCPVGGFNSLFRDGALFHKNKDNRAPSPNLNATIDLNNKHNKTLIALLIISLLMISGIISENILDINKVISPSIEDIGVIGQEPIDVSEIKYNFSSQEDIDAIKKKISDAGIVPKEAKHWK